MYIITEVENEHKRNQCCSQYINQNFKKACWLEKFDILNKKLMNKNARKYKEHKLHPLQRLK